MSILSKCLVLYFASVEAVFAQAEAYADTLPTDPPYYRVRYDVGVEPGRLAFAAGYRAWIPPGVETLRGVVVHQHGCGEGSCKSGQTGAFDLQWQALARKHDCALLSPVYEQPQEAVCALWCDPRNGSDLQFQQALRDLGKQCRHPELATVPWALWGHSGGAHWSGGMTLLHPDRVAAAWLRSGAPPLEKKEGRPDPWTIPDAVRSVPVMCNLGTKEGVTVTDGRFAGVWKGVEPFFLALRAHGGIAGVAVDPLTSHECGNQRYLAIPWLDACLTARLPAAPGEAMRPMPEADAWLAPLDPQHPDQAKPVPARDFTGPHESSIWLPNSAMAAAWSEYVRDTRVTDTSPPPAPRQLQQQGRELTWTTIADLESGLAGFVIERDGAEIARLPAEAKNPFGRPIFQNNSYSDTPTQPLVEMEYTDITADPGRSHRYRVRAINTTGLLSE